MVVSTLEDALGELTESFTASLSNPSQGLRIGDDGTATVTIEDNEGSIERELIVV